MLHENEGISKKNKTKQKAKDTERGTERKTQGPGSKETIKERKSRIQFPRLPSSSGLRDESACVAAC